MNENILQQYADKLENLKNLDNFRSLRQLQHQGNYIQTSQGRLLNLANNDYLGIAQDRAMYTQFLDEIDFGCTLGSSSSRLLTGNHIQHEQLEQTISQKFAKSALLFNSGYHANLGILPALCDDKTLILADKLVHASMIDGIRLSRAKSIRYQHNNLEHLTKLLEKYQNDTNYDKIIIVTESIFSMDGDESDLKALVKLKQIYPKTLLYIDEAHAIGVRGASGLGCVQEHALISQIDFIVGAFGKAIASVGGYVVCHEVIRQYLINTVRPLIFSTALPPMNMAWTNFVINRLPQLQKRRNRLALYQENLINFIQNLGWSCSSSSQIVPVILGSNEAALYASNFLCNQGVYAMAVRPPTVPNHQARLRICLNSELTESQFEQLKDALLLLKKNID